MGDFSREHQSDQIVTVLGGRAFEGGPNTFASSSGSWASDFFGYQVCCKPLLISRVLKKLILKIYASVLFVFYGGMDFQRSFIHNSKSDFQSVCFQLLCILPLMFLISNDGLFIFTDSHESPFFDFIESCLRNKHEMVIYEAASAIIHLPNCTARELAPAVSGWLYI